MDHVDIINYLIERNNYQSYLEIGLGEGVNFLQVNCRYKESVDPYENFLDALRNTRETKKHFIGFTDGRVFSICRLYRGNA